MDIADRSKRRGVEHILAVCSMTLLILGTSLYAISFDRGFYEKRFTDNNLEGFFHVPLDVITTQFEEVLLYIDGKIPQMHSGFFNDKEKNHLRDVRELFETLKTLIVLSACYLLAYLSMNRHEFPKMARASVYTLIAIVLILGIATFFQFDALFIGFHKMLFSNDLWLLDPQTDNLIILLPESVFVAIAQRWLALVGLICMALYPLTGYLDRRFSKTL